MKNQGKRVLITGADGFIGSHLVERCLELDYKVKAFVHYNSFNSWGWLDSLPEEKISEIEIIPGDVRDPNGIRKAVSNVDIVFHLAALIAIPFSYHSPDSYIDTNIKGTLNVLQAVRDSGVSCMVHTSTSEVYGTARYVPINEDHPNIGQSPYSASKIGADQLALSFYQSFETPVKIIRPFNTYGPRQSARAVIPTVITQLTSGVETLKLGSLHPTRDFTYVTDTVEGFIRAAQSVNCMGDVVNLGSNFEISIHDTVRLISELMDKHVDIKCDDVRLRPTASEVDRLWADNSKAKEAINWEPRYTGRDGFKRGLLKTIEWFSNPDNLKTYKIGVYNV